MKTPFPQSLLYRAPGRRHGAAGEGPLGKTQLNMDKVKGGLKMQIKQSSAFLRVHSGASSISVFTLGYCAHPRRASQPLGQQSCPCPRAGPGRAGPLTPAGC